MITDRALHEITRPVCNQEAPITGRNYEISGAQALQIGPVISCNQESTIESGDYKGGPDPRVEIGIGVLRTPVSLYTASPSVRKAMLNLPTRCPACGSENIAPLFIDDRDAWDCAERNCHAMWTNNA